MSAIQTFNDDFTSLNLWNGTSGTWSTTTSYVDPNGNGSSLPSNGEQEWYINNLYAPTAAVKPWTVANGILTLTAAPTDASVAQYLGYNQAGLPAMGSYQYTSGLIETNHSFTQTYGYFEMKAELPAGQGAWPAFWLMPADGSWPPELDVMEVLGNDPTKLYTTVHTAQTGAHTSSGVGTLVADMSTGYHTYGVDWETDKITFYFDGKAIYQVDTPADMHKPMYMIANLAMGGYWPGNVDSSTPLPAHMDIDYIRAYATLPTDVIAQEQADAAVAAIPSASGVTLKGIDSQAQTLVGGVGPDTLIAGHNADTLTGGGGADTFAFKVLPWSPSHVTDFAVGVDKIDLSALYTASSYTGSNPVADGYLFIDSDGAGGTKLSWDPDGHGTASPWPYALTILDHVSPTGLTAAVLTGASQPAPGGSTGSTGGSTGSTGGSTGSTGGATGSTGSTGSTAGVALTATDAAAQVLTGGSGDDTLAAAHNGATLTGGAGADRFVFGLLPWSAGHVTDFAHGSDKLDFTTLLTASHYTGADAVGDGYVKFIDSGAGSTWVYYDTDGKGTTDQWGTFVTTLDHVVASTLGVSDLTAASAGSTTTGGSTGGSTGSTGAGSTGSTGGSTTTSGQALVADATHTTLVGGAGADTLTADHGPDTLTGNGGADRFVFGSIAWSPSEITDFTHGTDKLDVSTLLTASHYAGSDPIADGYVKLIDNGHGGTWVYYDTDGKGTGDQWGTFMVTLDHVAPSQVTAADLAGVTAAAPAATTPTTTTTAPITTTTAPITTTTAPITTTTAPITTSAAPVTSGGGGGAAAVAAPLSLDGGSHADSMTGASGADSIRGMDGNDTVDGGAGNDNVNGNAGDDLVYGGTGDDSVMGGQGNDTVYGGGPSGDDGHNVVNGNKGNDVVYGSENGDTLYGGQDADTIHGGASADVISGDLGNDILFGGGGADRFVFAPGGGVDWIADFRPGEGDVIVLQAGVHYTLVDNAGQALLDLGHGDMIGLGGIAPSSFSADWVTYA